MSVACGYGANPGLDGSECRETPVRRSVRRCWKPDSDAPIGSSVRTLWSHVAAGPTFAPFEAETGLAALRQRQLHSMESPKSFEGCTIPPAETERPQLLAFSRPIEPRSRTFGLLWLRRKLIVAQNGTPHLV